MYNLFYSEADKGYICRGVEYPDVIGVGDSKEEAIVIYTEILEDYLEELRKDRIINSRGSRK